MRGIFTKQNLMHPIYTPSVVFIAVGYLLYFLTLSVVIPEWAREFINELSPTLKSLQSAMRVANERGGEAFPAQVMILYGVSGFGMLSLVFCLGLFIPSEHRNHHFNGMNQRLKEKNIGRVQVFFVGLLSIVMSFLYIAFWFSDTTKNSIGWRAHQIYSGNFFSVTVFNLLAPNIIALLILASTSMVYLSMKNGDQLTQSN